MIIRSSHEPSTSENNSEVEGSWLENIYRGVGSDVPAHSYVFPFEPNSNLSKCYAGDAATEKYIVHCVDKYGLKDPGYIQYQDHHVHLEPEVRQIGAQAQKNDKIIHDETDALIKYSQLVENTKIPNIIGLDQFAGKLVHTAVWDTTTPAQGRKN
ncbi:hypothetical protein PENFLA_c024G06435 [Penicillium flavigenum]|uniref:Uncharacterized protein n=1 Tax=Penicillium flavigenum TaxID=254877 RepID=A0A1V6STL9_9EURO|nr:hypothetical protein PENFLA_c024G06435 [Penicillium flavigenum]